MRTLFFGLVLLCTPAAAMVEDVKDVKDFQWGVRRKAQGAYAACWTCKEKVDKKLRVKRPVFGLIKRVHILLGSGIRLPNVS